MRNIVFALVAMGLLTTVVRAEDAADSAVDKANGIMEKMLETMDKMTAQLNTVKDEETAKAAGVELKKLVPAMKECMTDAKKLDGELSEEDKAKLKTNWEAKIKKSFQKFMAAAFQASQVEGAEEHLKDAMKGMQPGA